MTGIEPRRVHWLVSALLLAFLVALPVQILRNHCAKENRCLDLIQFGQYFRARALPEVREHVPGSSSHWGYDGQFYAQVALRPSLEDPALENALDNPRYRARRIGLPVMAYVLGLGKPEWILLAYALLNPLFWLAALVLLVRFVGWQRPRDLLLAFALLACPGTLSSVSNALTDLPAAVLGAVAIVATPVRGTVAASLLSAAALVKETSVLSLGAARWRGENRKFACAAILFAPILLWLTYVQLRLDGGTVLGHSNFALPFTALAQKLWGALRAFGTAPEGSTIFGYAGLFFEIVGPLSLLVQASYLATNARLASPAWRFGAGFAVLLVFLSSNVWVVEGNYMRVLLPLTFAFNLLLHRHEAGWRFKAWYVTGNASLGSVLFFQL